MYDELVERLRAGEYTLEELSIILPKAADAIEDLSRRETPIKLDELIQRLRESKKEQCYIGCFGNCGNCKIDAELEQAADAIEAMSEYVDTMRRLKCEGWQLQQVKFRDGYQAMSIMSIPEPPKEEI